MPESIRDQWNRIAHAISKMRAERISLSQAAREFDLDRKLLIKLGRSALRKGPREVATRNSEQASLLGKYWSAVQRYLQTGDDSELRKFEGQSVIAQSGEAFPLITNLSELDRLASAGVFSFESLYARSA
jgi:hypothetical protein